MKDKIITINNNPKIGIILGSGQSEIKKIINDAIIDDKEEYLVIKTIMIQDKQNINPSFKDKAKSIPK